MGKSKHGESVLEAKAFCELISEASDDHSWSVPHPGLSALRSQIPFEASLSNEVADACSYTRRMSHWFLRLRLVLPSEYLPLLVRLQRLEML